MCARSAPRRTSPGTRSTPVGRQSSAVDGTHHWANRVSGDENAASIDEASAPRLTIRAGSSRDPAPTGRRSPPDRSAGCHQRWSSAQPRRTSPRCARHSRRERPPTRSSTVQHGRRAGCGRQANSPPRASPPSAPRVPAALLASVGGQGSAPPGPRPRMTTSATSWPTTRNVTFADSLHSVPAGRLGRRPRGDDPDAITGQNPPCEPISEKHLHLGRSVAAAGRRQQRLGEASDLRPGRRSRRRAADARQQPRPQAADVGGGR
ncbi:hypothetical protein EDD28_2471 [Salana multivorans]|uniref:Uncharacterized protein n=1 Tax=Salana multivorans TaxID=120377 RepID=A0A3N2DDK0_9MICO|nr:hypothetical protein EDD28_2471 [Salana multivorans]